jgi:hypothetical protein
MAEPEVKPHTAFALPRLLTTEARRAHVFKLVPCEESSCLFTANKGVTAKIPHAKIPDFNE